MVQTSLFEEALKLEQPWYVEKTEFDDEARRLDVHLNFRAGGTFPCGSCDRDCKAYDTTWKRWRHLNFFEYDTHVHAPSPRVNCRPCGIKQARLPWARPRSRFTLLFEALVVAMATEMPVRAVGRMVGEYDTRLWRIVNHYMGEAESATDPEVGRKHQDESGGATGEAAASWQSGAWFARAPGRATSSRPSVPHAKSP